MITAAITSTFVERARREVAPSDAENRAAEQLQQIDRRLERTKPPERFFVAAGQSPRSRDIPDATTVSVPTVGA